MLLKEVNLLKSTEGPFQVLTLDVPLPEALQVGLEQPFDLHGLLPHRIVLHLQKLRRTTHNHTPILV